MNSRFLTFACQLRTSQIKLNLKQLKCLPAISYGEFIHVRTKHITSGVQGRRSVKTTPKKAEDEDEDDFEFDLTNPDDKVSLKDRYDWEYSY